MVPSPVTKAQSANQTLTKNSKRNRYRRRTRKRKQQDRIASAAEEHNRMRICDDEEFKKKIDSTITSVVQESLLPDLSHFGIPDFSSMHGNELFSTSNNVFANQVMEKGQLIENAIIHVGESSDILALSKIGRFQSSSTSEAPNAKETSRSPVHSDYKSDGPEINESMGPSDRKILEKPNAKEASRSPVHSDYKSDGLEINESLESSDSSTFWSSSFSALNTKKARRGSTVHDSHSYKKDEHIGICSSDSESVSSSDSSFFPGSFSAPNTKEARGSSVNSHFKNDRMETDNSLEKSSCSSKNSALAKDSFRLSNTTEEDLELEKDRRRNWWTSLQDCSFLMHEANVVVDTGCTIPTEFSSKTISSSAGTPALFKESSRSCVERTTDNQTAQRITEHKSPAIGQSHISTDLIEWQKFLSITIARVQSKEYGAPLQSMCILDCTTNDILSRTIPDTPNPNDIHTIHAFERQPDIHFHSRHMIMVIDYYKVYHFSAATQDIPKIFESVLPFRTGKELKLVQTMSNVNSFCSDRLDITYNLTVNPLNGDGLLAFEKRLDSIIEEVVDGVSLYLHNKRQTIPKCDRGTSPLFTKGATTQEASMQKNYRILNGTIATRPGVNTCCNLVSEDTNVFLIKAYLMTSIVNHHHASRDKKPFALTQLNTEPFARDSVYCHVRRACRILLYKEMLGSLYQNRADLEFRYLVGLFCQMFGILEPGQSATYAECIEVIADYLPEAHAVRWSSDCGGHHDKLTCEHFPLTLAYSFRHCLNNIQNTWLRELLGGKSHGLRVTVDSKNELRPQIIDPPSPDDLQPYQNCMYAAYSRSCLHHHAVMCSLRSSLFKSSDFCPLAGLVYFVLKDTQASMVDYYHIFENEMSLIELCAANNDQDTTVMENATLSAGKCYKSPQTLTRMVSTFM